MEAVIFLILSVVVLGCALVVVASRNIFHSAIFLAFSLIGVAGLYLLLQAEFLFGIQILIYVGAIVALIVFTVMLTRDLMDRSSRATNRQWPFAAGAALLMFGVLAVVVLSVQWPATSLAAPSATLIADLGEAMMGSYLIPFEVVSTLLLVALVGSIIIARER